MKNSERIKAAIINRIQKMPADEFVDLADMFLSGGEQLPTNKSCFRIGMSYKNTVCRECKNRGKELNIVPPCQRDDDTGIDPCLVETKEYLEMEVNNERV